MWGKSKVCLVFLMISSVKCTENTEDETACEAAQVEMGRTAKITCRFGRNVSVTKDNIEIKLYRPHHSGTRSLVKCNWLVRKPDEPTCHSSKGCHITSTLTDTMTMEIENATKEFEGKYVCHLVPAQGVPTKPCSLVVKESPPSEIQESVQSENNNLRAVEPRGGQNSENSGLVLIVVLSVSLVCNLASIALFLIWRKKRQCKNTRNVPQKDATQQDNGSESLISEPTI